MEFPKINIKSIREIKWTEHGEFWLGSNNNM